MFGFVTRNRQTALFECLASVPASVPQLFRLIARVKGNRIGEVLDGFRISTCCVSKVKDQIHPFRTKFRHCDIDYEMDVFVSEDFDPVLPDAAAIAD